MSDPDTKPDTLTIMCPECRELLEISDPRTILLAHHLDRFGNYKVDAGTPRRST